jgi:hypothetical protein
MTEGGRKGKGRKEGKGGRLYLSTLFVSPLRGLRVLFPLVLRLSNILGVRLEYLSKDNWYQKREKINE